VRLVDDFLHDSGKRNGGFSVTPSVLILINGLLGVPGTGHGATSFRAGGFAISTIFGGTYGAGGSLRKVGRSKSSLRSPRKFGSSPPHLQ
jgi:hypothetical protein